MCFTHFKKSTTARIHTTQRHARVREEFVENNFYKLIFFPQITGLVIHGLAFELEKSKLFKQGPANTRQDIQRYFTGVCSWEAGTVTGVFYWICTPKTINPKNPMTLHTYVHTYRNAHYALTPTPHTHTPSCHTRYIMHIMHSPPLHTHSHTPSCHTRYIMHIMHSGC